MTPRCIKNPLGKMFISADSQRQSTFINCAKRAAKVKNFQSLFPPLQSGGPAYRTVLEKVLEWLDESIFIVMDVTPNHVGGQGFINSGVLIEFGIAAATNKLDQLSLFVEESVSRRTVHPFINSKEIIKYSEQHPRVLTRLIKEEIDDFIEYRLHRPRSPIRPFG